MFYRVLSISLLCSILIHAGDVPPSPGTVEMENNNPENPPQMPQLNPQPLYTDKPQPSSDVGSSTGGSIINFLSDLLRVEQPNINKIRKDKRSADFQASLQKCGEHTTAQFFPEEYAAYAERKYNQEMTKMFAEAQKLASQVKETPMQEPIYTGIPTPFLIPEESVQLQESSVQMEDALNKIACMAVTPSPIPRMSAPGNLPPSGGSTIASGLQVSAAGGSLLVQGTTTTTSTTAATTGVAAAEGTTWGAALAASAPVVVAFTAGAAIGIGLAVLYDGIFNPGIGWCPSPEERTAYHAKRAPGNTVKVLSKTVSNNSGGGSPSPQGPKKPRDRKSNTVQRTEALKKIKKDYKYNKQLNKYILKDNGSPIECTRTGKRIHALDWDGQHGDIEAYLKGGKHMGSLDPETFKMYKGPVFGREL